ncbi:MAG: hypothetical protein IIB03_09850 [Acidobacteria bacterium]|nr:hypothetical protein [Acidobacteriota bacterium]
MIVWYLDQSDPSQQIHWNVNVGNYRIHNSARSTISIEIGRSTGGTYTLKVGETVDVGDKELSVWIHSPKETDRAFGTADRLS